MHVYDRKEKVQGSLKFQEGSLIVLPGMVRTDSRYVTFLFRMKREKGERIGDPFYRFFIGKREGTL